MNTVYRILNGEERAFDDVYYTHRGQFLALFKKCFGLSFDDARDLYQEACAAFYNNIKSGRITAANLPESSIRAYLNNTGKYILYNKRRKRQTPLMFEADIVNKFAKVGTEGRNYEEILRTLDRIDDEQYDSSIDNKLLIIRSCVREMPNPCAQLLDLLIYQERKPAEVAQIMQYANVDSVKTQKSRCIKKLSAIVNKQYKLSGYE